MPLSTALTALSSPLMNVDRESYRDKKVILKAGEVVKMSDEQEKVLIQAILDEGSKAGIAPLRIRIETDEYLTATTLDGINATLATTSSVKLFAAGILSGKLVDYTSDTPLAPTPKDVVSGLKASLPNGRSYKPEWFTKPGARLGKSDTYSSKLAAIPSEIVKKSALKVYMSAKAYSPKVDKVSATATLFKGRVLLISSDGLSLSYKRDSYGVGGEVEAKDGGEKASFADSRHFYKNLDSLDERAIGQALSGSALAKLGAQKAKAGVSMAVLSPSVSAYLLRAATTHLSGTNIVGGKSVYAKDLGKDVFSPMVTVLNDPFMASGHAKPFDGEGTPTEKFMAIDHGRLRCFFLDNECGELLGQKSNGCHGSFGCEAQYLVVTPSDGPATHLFNEAKEGVIVSEIAGKGKIDYDTLSFSLPFAGFAISSGLKSEPIMGEISGKLDELLKNVVSVSREREDCFGCFCPWFLVKDLKVD